MSKIFLFVLFVLAIILLVEFNKANIDGEATPITRCNPEGENIIVYCPIGAQCVESSTGWRCETRLNKDD